MHQRRDEDQRDGALTKHLLANGYSVTAYDQRGHGLSDGLPGHVEAFSEYDDDLNKVIALTRSRAAGRPLFIIGHSMGGLVALRYLARKSGTVAGAIISAPLIAVAVPVPAHKLLIARIGARFAPRLRLNNEIVNKLKKPIMNDTPASTPIYEFRKAMPVLAPSAGKSKSPRHQITVGEFRKASGTIAAKCIDGGTRVALSLSGLIPHGVYTVWVAKPDPTDQTHMKMSGVGAIGKEDGSQNSFTADEDGEAYISAVTPGGELSTMGNIANCWLTGEPMVQIAGVYHIDGKTHGPVIGPDGTYVGQFAFVFAQMPPPGAKPMH